MAESWTWTYLDNGGNAIAGEGLTSRAFPTQVDAEAWFGETWEELAEAGVASVTLRRDGVPVYGPMSLSAP